MSVNKIELDKSLLEKVCLTKEARDSVEKVFVYQGPGNGGQHTAYELMEPDRKTNRKKESGACFSSLVYNLRLNLKKSVFKLTPYKITDEALQKDNWIVLRWVQICQEAGALPADQLAEDILTEGLWIDLKGSQISPTSFYIWCSLLRYVTEAPRSVINAVRLVDEGGHDFWASVVMAQYLANWSTGHNFVNLGTGPYTKGNESKPEQVLLLHQWARNPKSVDKRVMFTEVENPTGDVGWRAHEIMAKLPPNNMLKNPVYILADAFKPLWRAQTAKQITEQLSAIKENIPDAFAK